jgi:hypothetical protein
MGVAEGQGGLASLFQHETDCFKLKHSPSRVDDA